MILVLLLNISFGGNPERIWTTAMKTVEPVINNPVTWASIAAIAANSGAAVIAVISSPVTLPVLAGVGVAGAAVLAVAALLEDDDEVEI